MRTPSRSLLVAGTATLAVAAGAGTAVAAGTTSHHIAPQSSKEQIVKISANKSGALMFSTKTLKAKPGKTKIEFTNNSPETHNFTLDLGSKKIGATRQFQGGTESFTVTLKKGSYTYFCDVPGHRQAGMQGTLKVS